MEREKPRQKAVLSSTVLCVASFLLGMLTFSAQGFLPDAFRSFANSSSGWTLLTAALVFGSRVGVKLAAALGALSFVLLVLGYTAAATLSGLFYSPLLFGLVGLVAGPFVGLATAWLRSDGIRAALGTALLSGIFTGEAAYGLTVVGDTTRPEYWLTIGALGIALLVAMAVRRLRGWRSLTLAFAGTAVVAVAFNLAYVALGSV